jgi:hypothetical protein
VEEAGGGKAPLLLPLAALLALLQMDNSLRLFSSEFSLVCLRLCLSTYHLDRLISTAIS